MHAIDKLARMVGEVKEDAAWEIKLTPETNLVDEVGLDSLQLIQLMLKVEEQFNVQMDFERFDYEHLQTARAFIGFLESLGAEVQLHA
ncbi:acyl carrier protein [Paenibacillus sp. MER 180]|uniref:acyl carrier protein n=1 Tax=unclassified Paenibacillus TaxID=185978 RepID=UPI0009F6C4F1|nr:MULTISPECIES: acyl carrier protein [unclassified Paenibacillus]MCM3292529.1 acyl carrier protein [Paenibacillus sp. MER 180]